MMIKEEKQLQDQRLKFQVELNNLLNTSNPDKDKVSELKADIKHLSDKIEKIVGKNEIKRHDELKRKKTGIDEIKRKNYYAFKSRYKKISAMERATARMIMVIENLEKNKSNDDEIVKIKAI